MRTPPKILKIIVQFVSVYMINNASPRVFGNTQECYGDKSMDTMSLLSIVLCRVLQPYAVVPQPSIWSDAAYELPVRRMDDTLAIYEVLGVPRNFLKLAQLRHLYLIGHKKKVKCSHPYNYTKSITYIAYTVP